MKKAFQVAMLAMAIMLVLSTAAFAGGPADKATGTVWRTVYGSQWEMSFNAHEAKGNRPEKGYVSTYQVDPPGGTPWTIEDVECVLIEGNVAYFGGDTGLSGDWSWRAIKVIDNGEPSVDEMVYVQNMTQSEFDTWCSNPSDPSGTYDVYAGNVKVHTR
ncbi:MAG: hypothetical protein U9R25_09205 [Chloroflexota bacterium]|nr:hypothetical protein [Chloroflexota bacterium]